MTLNRAHRLNAQKSCTIAAPIAAALFFCVTASAQFSLDGTTLQTGGGQTLATASEELSSELFSGAFLRFGFSFGTDELATGGEFKDAFSVSLFDEADELNTILFTADVFGVHWAPVNPGGVAPGEGAFRIFAGEAPSEMSGFASVSSFNVIAEIPEAFTGSSVHLRLDLFDNMNAAQSAGYIDQIAVIPEPSTLALTCLFLTVGLLARKLR